MLGRVNERYVDLTIQKEDVQFIVQQRLLQKNEHQKAQIRKLLLSRARPRHIRLHSVLSDRFIDSVPFRAERYSDHSEVVRFARLGICQGRARPHSVAAHFALCALDHCDPRLQAAHGLYDTGLS